MARDARDSIPIRLGPAFERSWPAASIGAVECIMNLLRTADWASARHASLLRPYDLTTTQLGVLAILYDAGEPIPHHVIGTRLLTKAGTVSWLVDGLERRGLVRRVPHPTSRRTVLVALTEEAVPLVREILPLLHAADRAMVADLNAEEQETLVSLLGRVQLTIRMTDACQGDSAPGGEDATLPS